MTIEEAKETDRKRNVSNDKVNWERAVKQQSWGKSIWRVVAYQESLTICGGIMNEQEDPSLLGIASQVNKINTHTFFSY